MRAMEEKCLWFAVQVVPHHEIVVDRLLSCKGYECFLPMCTVKRAWSDRLKTLQQPLFPGYIFCRSRQTTVTPILRTSGVIRIVSFGGTPCAVPDSEIEDLRQVIQSQRQAYPVPFLAIGRKVQMKTGPLTGIVGIVTKFKKRDRLVLSVESIMRGVAIEVDAWEVADVTPPSSAALKACAA